MTPEAKVTRAGLVLSAAFLAPERARRGTVNLEYSFRATCPLCGGRRALTLRSVKDGRLRLATKCGCDGERVWDAIGRAAELNLGESWGLDRGDVEIVTGCPQGEKNPRLRRARHVASPGSS